jgi:two-component system OmpR family sensor kinase
MTKPHRLTGDKTASKLRLPLRARVLAGVLMVTLAALVAFDVAAVSALRRYLLTQTDSQLYAVLRLYRPGRLSITAPPSWHVRGAKPNQQVAVSGPHLQLRPSQLDQYNVTFVPGRGTPTGFVSGNRDLVPRLPKRLPRLAAIPRAWTVASQNGHVQLRVLAARIGVGAVHAGTLVVTTSLAGVDKTVARLRLILIIGSAAAGLVVALGVAWVVRRGLRPIEAMAAQADRISAGDLTDRVGVPDAASEVARLGAALNGMLARIEASVGEREANQELTRQFFADASHELRTPLASLRAYAELYQQGALPRRSQVDEAMRRIGLEAKRMSALVDDMLRLARLDQHPERLNDPVDLTSLVHRCAERAQVADPVRTWHTCIAPGLVTLGDEELLTRAVDNLLANVRAHTPGDTVAVITATSADGQVRIEVSDDGPGVPAGHLSRVFDRFYRVPCQPHRLGSGLGLAIVSAVATAHHGAASAAGNHPHGLRVTLALPVAGHIAADPAPTITELSGIAVAPSPDPEPAAP